MPGQFCPVKWWLCNCVIFTSKCIDGAIKNIKKIEWVDGWSIESGFARCTEIEVT